MVTLKSTGCVFDSSLVVFVSGEASSGKHVTNMDTVRNLEWATSTCTLAFSTFGRPPQLTAQLHSSCKSFSMLVYASLSSHSHIDAVAPTPMSFPASHQPPHIGQPLNCYIHIYILHLRCYLMLESRAVCSECKNR